MRIAIDISLAKEEAVGIGRYSLSLANALKEIDRENEYIMYQNCCQRALWLQIWVPVKNLINQIDVFHATNLVAPLFSFSKTVVTIHDLSSMLCPETHTWLHKMHMSLIPISARIAKKIIVPTKGIKQEVVEHLNVSPDKIHVIHEGVDERFKVIVDQSKISALKNKYGLPENFILYLGTLEPRKNIINLLKSFQIIKQKVKDVKLVIAGKKGWRYQQIFKKVAEYGIEKDTVFPGYIADSDLVLIYNSARVFVYPSFYEGFGLPVLEAMACGIPTVTSNVPSIAEVAGEGALIVDPNDPGNIAEAILLLVGDKMMREKIISRALDVASRFSWRKCAEETLNVYRSLF